MRQFIEKMVVKYEKKKASIPEHLVISLPENGFNQLKCFRTLLSTEARLQESSYSPADSGWWDGDYAILMSGQGLFLLLLTKKAIKKYTSEELAPLFLEAFL